MLRLSSCSLTNETFPDYFKLHGLIMKQLSLLGIVLKTLNVFPRLFIALKTIMNSYITPIDTYSITAMFLHKY